MTFEAKRPRGEFRLWSDTSHQENVTPKDDTPKRGRLFERYGLPTPSTPDLEESIAVNM